MMSKAATFDSVTSVNQCRYYEIDSILESIRLCKIQKQIDTIRATKDETLNKKLKAKLPSICFSVSRFEKHEKAKTLREDLCVVEHSGYVILDFDKLPDAEAKKAEMATHPFVYSAFISPNGNGVKALVKIPPDKDKHRGYYRGLMKIFPELDPTSINLSRVCYGGADAKLYLNKSVTEFADFVDYAETATYPLNVKRQTTDYNKLNIGARMIADALDGHKHEVLIKASKLMGGYISSGLVDEADALHMLETEIGHKNIADMKGARKTIRDGIEYGKRLPIFETEEFSKYNPIRTYINPQTKIIEPKQGIEIKNFSQWVDPYLDYVYAPQSDLTTGIQGFDEILRYRIKGKLGIIIGYGGAKKSLFALNSCMLNIQNFKSVCIYSTMEMSINMLMNRIVDISIDYNDPQRIGRVNSSYMLEKKERSEVEQSLKANIGEFIGDCLFLTQNSSATCEYYDKYLETVFKKTGKVDCLVVDGLSMMGGSDKEVDRFSQNSKELKELANKWDIYVQLICHASKGSDKATRDLTDKIRGSEKIADNCDFMITMSQLIDERARSETTEYRSDKGYIRFYDKRGSGKILNRIYDFDPYKLTLTETDEDPDLYEVKTKSKKGISL